MSNGVPLQSGKLKPASGAESVSAVIPGSITILKREIKTETFLYDQSELRFYVQNPRVYTIVRDGGKDPSQEDIQEKLLEMEHVRELILDIKRNGGLIEPLVVSPDTAWPR